jgi:hypothetical protein
MDPPDDRQLQLVCRENYEGAGRFVEGGWPAIAVAVARELVLGLSWLDFMEDLPPGDGPVAMAIEAMEALTDLTRRRLFVLSLVAPAVSVVAGNATTEHWTARELIAAVRQVVESYRPRVLHLVEPDEE